MPNHKSAIKRVRQNKVRKAKNFSVRSSYRTAMKKVREAVVSGSKETALCELKLATKMLDSAASKGVIHVNNAARHVSRLTKQVNSLP